MEVSTSHWNSNKCWKSDHVLVDFEQSLEIPRVIYKSLEFKQVLEE
jgi:hypothetical protein